MADSEDPQQGNNRFFRLHVIPVSRFRKTRDEYLFLQECNLCWQRQQAICPSHYLCPIINRLLLGRIQPEFQELDILKGCRWSQ